MARCTITSPSPSTMQHSHRTTSMLKPSIIWMPLALAKLSDPRLLSSYVKTMQRFLRVSSLLARDSHLIHSTAFVVDLETSSSTWRVGLFSIQFSGFHLVLCFVGPFFGFSRPWFSGFLRQTSIFLAS